METSHRKDSKEENLNDSWVEVREGGSPAASGVADPAMSRPQFLTQMEKLLLEAQRESSQSSTQSSLRGSSANSSRASPKSPHSPNNEPATESISSQINPVGSALPVIQATDWIWDWSSRPEAHPPSDWGSRFKHPKRHTLSVRNTSVMRSELFSLENLPTLLLTHACTFIMGAAVMFVYLKKYCRWAVVATQTMD